MWWTVNGPVFVLERERGGGGWVGDGAVIARIKKENATKRNKTRKTKHTDQNTYNKTHEQKMQSKTHRTKNIININDNYKKLKRWPGGLLHNFFSVLN